MSQFQPTQVIADFQEAPLLPSVLCSGTMSQCQAAGFTLRKRLLNVRAHWACRTHVRTTRIRRPFSDVSLSLLLLPAGDIMLAFDEVSSLLDDQLPSKTPVQQLLCYVSRQWLNKSKSLSVYETVLREPITLSRVFMQRFVVGSKFRIRTCSRSLNIFSKQPKTARQTLIK